MLHKHVSSAVAQGPQLRKTPCLKVEFSDCHLESFNNFIFEFVFCK